MSRGRRAVPPLAALLLLALLTGGPVGGLGATPAAAVESPTPTPGTEDSPVEVSVSKLAPRFLSDPEQFLQVAGTLRNTGSSTVRDLQLRLMVGERLQSRGGLARADVEAPALTPRGTTVTPTDTELGPGESVPFSISLRVRELRFDRLGVYPFGVRVRGRVDGFDGGRSQIGLVQTYLPWFPDGAPKPTRVAWVWPLVDRPSRAPREGIMVDDALTASVDRGGRLSQLVVGASAGGAGKCDDVAVPPADATVTVKPPACTPQTAVPVPMTYAVDPDLLLSVDGLTRDHTVLEGKEQVERPPSAAAKSWLSSLTTDLALARTDLLVLPYADPDAVALADDSDPRVRLESDFAVARGIGSSVVQTLLGQTSVLDVGWPAAGTLTQKALEATLGTASSVLLDETALPPPPVAGDAEDTPDARVALSSLVRKDVTGLVVDDRLSRLLEPGPATSGKGPRLAEQRWLVETAMVVAEAPSRSRTLVIAPPRRATVPQPVAIAAVADTGRVPWLCPVSLRDVVAGRDACPGDGAPAEPRTADLRTSLEAAASGETLRDLTGYLQEVDRLRRESDQFTDRVLEAGSEATATKARLVRARLRAESSAWRGEGPAARRHLALLQEDVKSLREQVTVRVGRKVTLTSDKGTIRANLQNSLDQRVTVRVKLTAPSARLSVETTPEFVLEPRTVKPVDLEVEALVSGQFVVEAQLLDRSMQPFGPPNRLIVRSTRYGRLALALTGLGAAGLLVAAGVRIVRRALRGTDQSDQSDQSGQPSPEPTG